MLRARIQEANKSFASLTTVKYASVIVNRVRYRKNILSAKGLLLFLLTALV